MSLSSSASVSSSRAAHSPPPLENTLLGPEDTPLVKTLSQNDAKTHFKAAKGDPIRANVYYIDGVPFRLQPAVFHKGMKKFLRLHKCLPAGTPTCR